MIIDATNLKLGRIATIVAKHALLGETVSVINIEKAVITGTKKNILAKYQRQYNRGGPHWGPFQPRMPDRFARKVIRNMLPFKTPRGREALKRISCFIGNPHSVQAQSIPDAHISNSLTMKYISLQELCSLLGGNV